MLKNEETESISLSVLNYIKNNGSFERPVPRKALSTRLGLSKRDVENAVEYLLVKKGHPILTKRAVSSHGYFIPKNDEERDMAIGTYRKQIETSIRNLNLKMSVDLSEYWKEELENAE